MILFSTSSGVGRIPVHKCFAFTLASFKHKINTGKSIKINAVPIKTPYANATAIGINI